MKPVLGSFSANLNSTDFSARAGTLDDLLASAEHYADHPMRNMGRMRPPLLLIGPAGPLMLTPESLADDSAKDDFATNAWLMCIAYAARSVVGAWAKFAVPSEKFGATSRLPRTHR